MRAARTQVMREGQAAGARLAERASHLLLTEYGNRKTDGNGEATKRLDAVVALLRKALGPVANDEHVATALHQLDGAIWDCAAEHEDRAWHAAWTVAMAIAHSGSARALFASKK